MRSIGLPAAAAAYLALLGPLAAEETPKPVGPRIHVTGNATLEAPPDFASVSVGVTSKAATTAAAIDGTSGSAAKIIEAARSAGIAPRDIQTGYVSLQPAYRTVRDSSGQSEQRPDGYLATNSVDVRVRDLARLGEILRTVVDSGANRISGVDFRLADPGRLELKALDAAVKDARRQADTIAAAAGVKLGRIEEIRYGERAAPVAPTGRARTAMAAPAPPVPVEAGSLEMSAEVAVVWAIEAP